MSTLKMTLSIPRDRPFDRKLIAKYQRRFPDLDDKIMSMYACGMSVRKVAFGRNCYVAEESFLKVLNEAQARAKTLCDEIHPCEILLAQVRGTVTGAQKES